ncbi:MAG: hypothetical protein QOH91_3002 [Mycobacterium sp.]|jgi:hypothetical protein|nr:hypothetical protein [Mycobacterium sp.]
MINMNAFGVGVAAAASVSDVFGAAGTSHAARTAAAGEHRVAAATDASVNRGHT